MKANPIDRERYERMKVALKNILEISSDDFAKHQAKWALGEEAKEVTHD